MGKAEKKRKTQKCSKSNRDVPMPHLQRELHWGFQHLLGSDPAQNMAQQLNTAGPGHAYQLKRNTVMCLLEEVIHHQRQDSELQGTG